jgi:hypothetical protein
LIFVLSRVKISMSFGKMQMEPSNKSNLKYLGHHSLRVFWKWWHSFLEL